MNFVATKDRTRLYVKDWGTGRPVILLHGWPLTSDSWDDQAMAIADAGYRAISYDRRGFGRSTQPWSGYDYDTLADDLAAIIEQTGAQDATLVGFSMGGGEVARYLSRHNRKSVVKAALVSSVVPYMLKTADNPRGTEAAAFEKMAQAITVDRARFFAGFFRSFFGTDTKPEAVSSQVLEWACNLSMQASLKATLACAKSFATTDFRADLPAFTIPTLIIHGTADKTVPMEASANAAAAAIAGSTYLTYTDSPHGLFATDKERLTRDLLHFLKQ
jgi:pimeloyl-ACP methyl ester carboxylesterase